MLLNWSYLFVLGQDALYAGGQHIAILNIMYIVRYPEGTAGRMTVRESEPPGEVNVVTNHEAIVVTIGIWMPFEAQKAHRARLGAK